MKKQYTSDIRELIEFNLDKLDSNETVEVNLKDLIYTYRTLQEYIRFFHQQSHYESVEDIHDFLGNYKQPSAFKALSEVVYEKLSNMTPEHINEKFDEGFFDSPLLPNYYKEKVIASGST